MAIGMRDPMRSSPARSSLLVALVLGIIGAADGLVANRKILLLHGSGGSAGAFLNHGALGIQGAAGASYHDGGRLAWQFGAVDWDLGIEADTDWGEWWTHTDASKKGLAASDKAIRQIEETVQTGGFDGIVGFGEGGMVAAVIAARAALGEEDCACADCLRFAVMCGAAVPTPYEDLLQRLEASSCAPLPTVHCLSKADQKFASERGERLARFFGDDAMVTWHDGGHAMPSASDCKEVVKYVDDAAPETYRVRRR